MTMASLNKNSMGSDDEDDLESLRLAALKSLKPKTIIETHKPLGISHCKPQHYNKPSTFGAAQTTRHHNRGFRNNPGRGGRNGINPRARTNTNLISIQTIDQDEPILSPKEVLKNSVVDIPKLILPQDRYHKTLAIENTTKETSGNKFDRYDDDSEDSESDSDELVTKPSRRERKDSVEQLMEDIENEINLLDGEDEPKAEEKSDTEELSDKIDTKDTNLEPAQSDTLIISETDPDIVQIDAEKPAIVDISPPYKKSRSRSRSPHLQKRKSRTRSRSRSPFLSQYRSPKRSRSPPRKVRYSPNHYPRALSPFNINTEVLNTITMAPLSPRSAAFVLQNREILARRQMSPRRSLSRESSCRRSLTPKRRRSRSPIRRSLSPRRRSLSPRNHHRRSPYKSTKRNSNSPVVMNKQPIHKRLGSRPNSRNVSPYLDRKTDIPTGKRKRTSRSISLSLSPSPDRNYHKRPLNETTGHVNERNRREKRKESPKTKEDPILEARRRKFETPVQINNGIIKLKTNKTDEETNEVKQEESPEYFDDEDIEENDEILDLNPTLDDLWSDEDSDDENEGRFKSKPSSETKKVTILPFRKLTERLIPKEPLLPSDNAHRDRKYKRPRRRRSRSPLKSAKSDVKKEPERDRVDSKSKITVEKVRTKPAEEEKKKEKSPVVVVKSETNKSVDILKTLHSEKNIKRKVKIRNVEVGDSNVENTEEPEIIIENEDDVVSNKDDDGGDLRAELSRRRAQRLIKAGSLAESLPTRLLKNALQEVVPKRSALKPSKLTKGNGSSADRRVRIIRRLASSPVSQLEPANKVANKEGKLPIHMRLGSNPDVEEPVRTESVRKGKRPRPNRRKKQVQV